MNTNKSAIRKAEKHVRCNSNHSGNRKLVFDVGYLQCQGCGGFHSVESALETIAGPVREFNGAGGLVRVV